MNAKFSMTLALTLMSACVSGHTTDETNEIARAMLGSELAFMHDEIDDVAHVRHLVPSLTWSDFLKRGEWNGWTPEKRKNAFAWYLSTFGTNDCFSMSAYDKALVRIAVRKCEQLDYTNSAPAMKALALNPRGIMRDEAVNLAVRFSPVDDATTEFVETIITNVHGYSSGERVGCYWEYAKKLRQDPCINGAYANAISMFYRNRKVDGTGAVTLDRLFADKIAGYAQSSNRLDTALFMLSVTNMRPRFVEHFTSVTNQLLSSGQPLPWIEVGTGGNGR